MAVRLPPRFTAAHLWETPDDEQRYEIVDGELYVSPAPNVAHQYSVGRLFVRLSNHVDARALGLVFTAPTGVVLDESTAVQPDILFLSHDRRALLSERGVEGAPDLVVEVLSPRTVALDRGIKMLRYAAARIPHFWLLDPRWHVLEAYVLEGTTYTLAARPGPGETFRPALFPGLEIVVDDLFLN